MVDRRASPGDGSICAIRILESPEARRGNDVNAFHGL
jgi:hypothetical protein